MAGYWAMRASPTTQGSIANANLGQYTVPRKPTIGNGDPVVLFHTTSSEIQFWGTGIVDEVMSQPGSERSEFSAVVTVNSAFCVPRSLDDYRFSLSRVYRFAAPERHFLRSYARISESDFTALVENEIHASRTAVGLLAEALPYEQRIRIAADLMEVKPQLLYTSHHGLLVRLLKHVRETYVEAAIILQDVAGLVGDLRADGVAEGVVVEGSEGSVVNLLDLSVAAGAVFEGFPEGGGSAVELLAGRSSDSTAPTNKIFSLDRSEVLLILQVV